MITYYEAKEIFIEYVKSYCAAATIDYYMINFNIYEKYLNEIKYKKDSDIVEITKLHYQNYITYLRNINVKNTSVRTYARAIKVFYRFLYNEGYIKENITKNVKCPKSDSNQIIPLTFNEVCALRVEINKSYLRNRNKLIFSLLLDCGMRIQEVVNLKCDDVNYKDKYIIIRNSKNNKSRIVPLPERINNELYMYENLKKLKGSKREYLILDNHYKIKMSEQSIKLIFQKLKKVVPRVHAHLLRHTFATSYIMGGGQLELLRVLLGHEGYDVTKNYIHIASQMSIIKYDIYKLDNIFFEYYKY